MLTPSFRLVAARVDARLQALSAWAVPIFMVNQGALLPTLVMTSIIVSVEILKKSAGADGAHAAGELL